MRIVLGADHGGFEVKECVKKVLARRGVEFEDLGCHSRDSVDYPDYAREVAARVSAGTADEGILVCTTGIGMSIAANRFPRVYAALCLTPVMAQKARFHNNANVLVLAGDYTSPETATAIVEAWLNHSFSGAERHQRRLRKIDAYTPLCDQGSAALMAEDPDVFRAIQNEEQRSRETINLIASENYASAAVRAAQGSVMTNKYAEGYPGKRWYNGCENMDAVERLAIERAQRLFGAEHVNVQPHSGSATNMAIYFSVLKPGDTILAMSLAHGGHLTHGHTVNFSGRFFKVVAYGVHRQSELIDYDEVAALARVHRPNMIVAGASSYPRRIDFQRFREIADSVGAYFMVDMAHISGLVAGGCHPSPIPYADFVSTTTHKTLRGPRSGLIMCRSRFAAEIDREVFPGLQGGPLMHVIAAKAVCFHEAARPEFRLYAERVIRNAQELAEVLKERGFRLVSGGTDNHLILVDLSQQELSGKEAAAALEAAGIIANKNVIPFDNRSPFLTSGIRLGTPAVTTRGMGTAEMRLIGGWIAEVLEHAREPERLAAIRKKVAELAAAFPPP